MIYKGKGKRTRFRRCRRSSWLHRAVLWWWIYQGDIYQEEGNSGRI